MEECEGLFDAACSFDCVNVCRMYKRRKKVICTDREATKHTFSFSPSILSSYLMSKTAKNAHHNFPGHKMASLVSTDGSALGDSSFTDITDKAELQIFTLQKLEPDKCLTRVLEEAIIKI